MADGQQDVFVWAVIAVAAGYLAWRGWQTFARRGANGCGGCAGQMGSGEDTDRAPKTKPFVSIDNLDIPFNPGRQAGKDKGKEAP